MKINDLKVGRLREGTYYYCTKCGTLIPNGKGVSSNKEAYCDNCAEKILDKLR